MEQRELTSDDLAKLGEQIFTRKDLVRTLRSALEKPSTPHVKETLSLVLQTVLEDMGYGTVLRAELSQELQLASTVELAIMRNALLRHRTTPRGQPSEPSTGTADEKVDEGP